MILYSTDHCTLCDQALELLFSMPELAGLPLRVVDVATEQTLLERLGERLPVLESPENGRQLDWPFDADAVLTLLSGPGSD